MWVYRPCQCGCVESAFLGRIFLVNLTLGLEPVTQAPTV